MTTRRKSILVFDHERSVLLKLYSEKRIPVGQFAFRAAELEELCNEWRGLTGRTDPNGDIFHYMRNERKCARWPKLDGEHVRKPKTPTLSADDVESLRYAYEDFLVAFGMGSENIAYNEEMKAFLTREFALRAGHVVAFEVLIARLTELRKRGKLTKLAEVPQPVERDSDTGFEDINAV